MNVISVDAHLLVKLSFSVRGVRDVVATKLNRLCCDLVVILNKVGACLTRLTSSYLRL